MKISRRALAQLALAGAASAQPAAPDDLEEARKQIERTSETLLKHQISMATEPAFQFKA
jgi:hypothetical protein